MVSNWLTDWGGPRLLNELIVNSNCRFDQSQFCFDEDGFSGANIVHYLKSFAMHDQ